MQCGLNALRKTGFILCILEVCNVNQLNNAQIWFVWQNTPYYASCTNYTITDAFDILLHHAFALWTDRNFASHQNIIAVVNPMPNPKLAENASARLIIYRYSSLFERFGHFHKIES